MAQVLAGQTTQPTTWGSRGHPNRIQEVLCVEFGSHLQFVCQSRSFWVMCVCVVASCIRCPSLRGLQTSLQLPSCSWVTCESFAQHVGCASAPELLAVNLKIMGAKPMTRPNQMHSSACLTGRQPSVSPALALPGFAQVGLHQ